MGLFRSLFVRTKEDIDREIASINNDTARWQVCLGNYRNNKDTANANTAKAHIAQNKARIASLKAQRRTAPNK